MAGQRRIQPLGILKGQEICIWGLKFSVTFVILRMEEKGNGYSMLLGRPWLRATRVK